MRLIGFILLYKHRWIIHYCRVFEGFDGSLYRFLVSWLTHEMHKDFFCFEIFKAWDEDLSAKCWGASYLIKCSNLCVLMLPCLLYLNKNKNMDSFCEIYFTYLKLVFVHIHLEVWMNGLGTWEDICQKLNLQLAVFIFSIYCFSHITEIGNGWVKSMEMINLFSDKE